jgi:hypothetical protein
MGVDSESGPCMGYEGHKDSGDIRSNEQGCVRLAVFLADAVLL